MYSLKEKLKSIGDQYMLYVPHIRLQENEKIVSEETKIAPLIEEAIQKIF